MKIDYALKEGFVDLWVFPTDVVSGQTRFRIFFKNCLGFRAVETSFGYVIINSTEYEAPLMIDKAICQKYGTPIENVENLNVDQAIQILNQS